MFVQRMMNDPEFRERMLTEGRSREDFGVGAHGLTLPSDHGTKGSSDVTVSGHMTFSYGEPGGQYDWRAAGQGERGTTREEWDAYIETQRNEAADDGGHERMAQIRVIAQALAFRKPDAKTDASIVHRLVNDAYSAECAGRAEGFRKGPLLDYETICLMLSDPACQWIVAEAPNGKGVVEDGTVLGCVCFSVGNAAAQTEEKSGALRLLAVLPSFAGLLVGRRLLRRAEAGMQAQGCRRCLCCVPNHRQSLVDWIERRGYGTMSTAAYPEELRKSFVRETFLLVMSKALHGEEEEVSSSSGQPKAGSLKGHEGEPASHSDQKTKAAERASSGPETPDVPESGSETGPQPEPGAASCSSHETQPPPPPQASQGQ